MSKLAGDAEEAPPSVEAVDQDERIAARRQRIFKRIEAAKREALGEDPNAANEIKEVASKSKLQIEDSRKRLAKLVADGTELVSNIQVAGDAREGQRRGEEEETRRQRRERLENEAKTSLEKFDEIVKKWELNNTKEIPQELHDTLMAQRSQCDAMIDEKNQLINDFIQELKNRDDQYVRDLKKQAEDIDLMIERMEEQIKNLTKAYREELDEIEKAFVEERNGLLNEQRSRWETLMSGRQEKENEFMKEREKRVEDYEKQIQLLRVQDSEEYNNVKRKLESDVTVLEQQLQQMKATCQLNQEKLEYNFQVLKKRDEENTITKSQQKRKITRLQDNLNNLRLKIARQEKGYRDENTQLTEDYKRITQQFKDLQKKSRHFMTADQQKFYDIWVMNERECKDLLEGLMECDRIITEQQLGKNWIPPDLSFTETEGPVVSEKSKKQTISASQVLQEVLSGGTETIDGKSKTVSQKVTTTDGSEVVQEEAGTITSFVEDEECIRSKLLQKISTETIKKILDLLCDEGGFLVESRLHRILAPLDRYEQSLIRLDAIFLALGIETEEDIFKLTQYFLQMKVKSPPTTPHEVVEEETTEATQATESVPESSPSEFADEDLGSEVEATEAPLEESEVVLGEDNADLIHPNDVLKAMKAFVESHPKFQQKTSSKSHSFQIAVLDERDDSEDSNYWNSYPQALSVTKKKIWDAMQVGMERYKQTLTQRSKLQTETDALRQQNAELRLLLQQYIHSKVNSELEIPPTRVLQYDIT